MIADSAVDKVINAFGNAVNNNKVAHAYLLSGGSDELRKKAAFQVAAILNCTVESGKACGACTSCKKIEKQNHPDIYYIEPEGASIKISTLRDLQRDIGYKRYEGKYRVIIISQADKMTPEAANCILKILEEPLEATIFLLLVKNKRNLLPTIESRCQHIFLGSEEQFKPMENFEGYLKKLFSNDRFKVIELASEIIYNEDLELFLDNLLRWYRDLLVWHETGSYDLLSNRGWVQSLKEYEMDLDKCITAIEKIMNAQNFITRNANKVLTMENLFLELVSF